MAKPNVTTTLPSQRIKVPASLYRIRSSRVHGHTEDGHEYSILASEVGGQEGPSPTPELTSWGGGASPFSWRPNITCITHSGESNLLIQSWAKAAKQLWPRHLPVCTSLCSAGWGHPHQPGSQHTVALCHRVLARMGGVGILRNYLI